MTVSTYISPTTVTNDSFGNNEYLVICKGEKAAAIFTSGKTLLDLTDKILDEARFMLAKKKGLGHKLSSYEEQILNLDKTS